MVKTSGNLRQTNKSSSMTLQEFRQQTPTVYGYVNFTNGGQKIGAFIHEQNRYTGAYGYRYYSIDKRGNLRRGNYSINTNRAFELLKAGQLSRDAQRGRRENYL